MSNTDVVVTLVEDVTIVPGADPDDVVVALLADQVLGATLIVIGDGGPGEGPGEGPGGGGVQHFVFTQASPAALWTIAHNLGRRPLIQVFTTGGVEVEAEILHLDANVARISFASPFAGQAICI